MVSAVERKAVERKSAKINMRVSSSQLDLIKSAASLLGRNQTEFILESACQRAEDVLLDRTFFVCDEQQWEKVCEALDRSPQENPKLAKVLTSKAPWES